jgi:hypothetical protein
MIMNPVQIILLLVGVVLIFFGLMIYRSLIKLVGFLVGGAYGLYLFTYLLSYISWDPVFVLLAAVGAVLVLGILGIFIAEFANAFMFFLAGGLIGVMLGKLVAGLPPDIALEMLTVEGVSGLIKPRINDLLWFVGGGLVFVVALDSLVMLALVALGAVMVRLALAPLQIMEPDWIIPGVVGLFGLMFQEALRRKSRARFRPVKSVKPAR